MRTVYKSNYFLCIVMLLGLVLLRHFFPEVRFGRSSGGYNPYSTDEERLESSIFLFIFGVSLLGFFCKTVIEFDDGFEVYYMFGLQKKWFGKDFLTFEMAEKNHETEHVRFWDGGKSTRIFPIGTKNVNGLYKRMEVLAEEFQNKHKTQGKVSLDESMKPNIKLIEDFDPQSYRLFHILKDSVDWDERMKARKTASFGVSYDYSGIKYPQTEMLDELVPLCERIKDEFSFYPNNCLMNYYPDGNSSLGFHSDSSEELRKGTGVVIISLGAEREIHYKNKEDRNIIVPYKLKSGTLLYMDKGVQDEWLHAIPRDENCGARISLTFREIVK